jgi:hypothetical protein
MKMVDGVSNGVSNRLAAAAAAAGGNRNRLLDLAGSSSS